MGVQGVLITVLIVMKGLRKQCEARRVGFSSLLRGPTPLQGRRGGRGGAVWLAASCFFVCFFPFDLVWDPSLPPMVSASHIQGGSFSLGNTLTGMPRVCLLGASKSRYLDNGNEPSHWTTPPRVE